MPGGDHGDDEVVVPTGRRRRHRVLPRTVLGLTAMILAFAVGAGFSGAVLYSYYQYRLDQNTSRVNTLVDGYRKQFDRAERDLSAASARAEGQIQESLAPIRHLEADPVAQARLVRSLAPSLWFVSTRDADGHASVGTAFVVATSSSESLLLTSYTTVQAATVVPGPPVYVRHGDDGKESAVRVRTWDAAHDLALIVLPEGGLTPVTVASPGGVHLGDPVYAIAGIGTGGASISQGEVDDTSSDGIAEDAPLGTAFQGGPIVDAAGQVLAVASRTYAPLGFTTSGVWYAPFVDIACDQVLDCPGGHIGASR